MRVGHVVGSVLVVAESGLHEHVELLIVLALADQLDVLGLFGDGRETVGNVVEVVQLDAVVRLRERRAAESILCARFLDDRRFFSPLVGKEARLPHDALSPRGGRGDSRRDALQRRLMAQLPLTRPVDKHMRAILSLVVLVDGNVRHSGTFVVLESLWITREISRADRRERGDARKTGCWLGDAVEVVESEVLVTGLVRQGPPLQIRDVAKLIGAPAACDRTLRTFGKRRRTDMTRRRVERDEVDDTDGDLDSDVR